MAMNIYILEDDFQQQSRIETTVREVLAENNWAYDRIEVNGKADQLLATVDEKGTHQIFFLDIEIKEERKKGFEVARKIRALDRHAVIVFVTTHSEFMPLVFQHQVSALDFVDKALPDEAYKAHIEKALGYVEAYKDSPLSETSFYFKTPNVQIQMPLSDILYIETSPRSHRVILYTETDRMEFTSSLTEILKQCQHLYQCHRSYLVNPQNVQKVDKTTMLVHFHNGMTCLVSRMKLRGLCKVIENLHGAKA